MRLIAAFALLLWGVPACAQEIGPLPAAVEANPVPKPAKDERWKGWRKAVLVAHAADFASTEICLRRGTCIEGNPLIGRNPSTVKLAGFKLATAALNYALITEMAKSDPKAARIFGMMSVGVFGGVAVANFRFAF